MQLINTGEGANTVHNHNTILEGKIMAPFNGFARYSTYGLIDIGILMPFLLSIWKTGQAHTPEVAQ